MPAVVYENIMTQFQPLPAGGRLDSAIFDVNGARTVSVVLSITSGDPDVHWTIHFGPAQNNGYMRVETGTFNADGGLARQFPVFGPQDVHSRREPWYTGHQMRRQTLLHSRAALNYRKRAKAQTCSSVASRSAKRSKCLPLQAGHGVVRAGADCAPPAARGGETTWAVQGCVAIVEKDSRRLRTPRQTLPRPD